MPPPGPGSDNHDSDEENEAQDVPLEEKLEVAERSIEELRALLKSERAIGRQWKDAAAKAAHAAQVTVESLLDGSDGTDRVVALTTRVSHEPPPREQSFRALPLTTSRASSGHGVDLKRLMGTSVIREIGVAKHFRNLADSVGESRRNISSTSVLVKELSLSYVVGQASKAFPTVGEAVTDPIVSLCKGNGKKTFEVKALQHITTALEPQKMYLVIGGPKSGKTSLLKAIAGRSLKGKGARVEGEVTYNGEKAGAGGFHITSLACFVEEVDDNEPLLTVRETLEFSGACIAPVPTKQIVDTDYFHALVASLDLDEAAKQDLLAYKNVGLPKVRRALAKQKANVVMALLGLTGCADTIIGDASRRGVSGGERRRVTLAEVLMGEYSVACFDEISNGLDSAATFDITKMAQASVQAFKYCCVISLNQPAPEVYGLFDEVLLLKKGALVYQGPPAEALGYFEQLGFRCPPKTDIADFLIRITGPTNRNLRAKPSELAEAGLPAEAFPKTTHDFVTRFRKSELGQALRGAAHQPSAIDAGGVGCREWKENETRRFYNTWWTSFLICLQREVALTLRDRSYIVSRVLQDLFLGLLTGFIFFNLSIEAVSTRYGALYQSLLTIAFQTAACIPAYFQKRKVFYKQKNAGFFSCSSYLLASTAAVAPLVLLDSTIFGAIVYWCTGFARDQHGLHFFVFLAHLTLLGWSMMSFFKLTTFVSPDLTSSAAVAGIVTFFLLLFSGFIISIKDVPGYYVWIMYLNPIFYAFQGLAVNEFISNKYNPLLPGSTKSLGETVLEQKGLYTDPGWAWWGLLANLGITVLYLGLTQVAMMKLEWLEPVNSADTSPEEAITQGSFALRQPGVSRRQLSVSKDGDDDLDGDDDASSHASESVATWNTGSSLGSLISLRPFNALGSIDEEAGADAETKMEERDGDDAATGGDIELGHNGGAHDHGKVKFSPHVSEAPSSTKSLEGGQSTLAPLPKGLGTMTSTKLMNQLRRGQSSTWQLQAVKAIPFVPTALSFQDLWYTVPLKGNETVDLLKGVNGSVVPGTMMALMGSSGAGKTTLLDVLAGRKTGGTIRGAILVNGVKVDASVFKTISAYVEQFGSVSPYMTVEEALAFNAELRLPKDVAVATRTQFVTDVLALLELQPIATSVVGPPGAGLSFEELKRVTIGCEVVANPSLLFLDEPTTGLDARAAMIVVRVMRKLAQTGRSIICTIHQPSQEIFTNFDSLLLLKRGGQTVFCGPLGNQSAHLKDYFESIPGTPKLGPGENPASWMLDCLGAGTGMGAALTIDYVAEWQTSALSATNLETLAALTEPPTEAQLAVMVSLKRRERATFGKQLGACTRRAWRSMWRMPEYQLARVGGCAAMGLVLGSLYFRQTQDNVAGLVSFIALFFLATTCVSNINSTAVLQIVALEKTSFCRERFNHMYQVSAYTLSWFLCEIPWVALQTLVYTLTFYPTCNYSLEPWRIGWFFVFSYMYILFSTAFGQAIGAVCPSVQVAQIVLNCLVPIFSMMSGMTILPVDLPPGWKFLWILTPLNKVFEGLVVTQWGGDNEGQIAFFSIRNKKFETLTRWEFVDEFFGT